MKIEDVLGKPLDDGIITEIKITTPLKSRAERKQEALTLISEAIDRSAEFSFKRDFFQGGDIVISVLCNSVK